jgi:hypothetical protein
VLAGIKTTLNLGGFGVSFLGFSLPFVFSVLIGLIQLLF